MPSIVPIPLAPGNVVRIIRGRGARVVAKRGLLWVSEEGDLRDHVLAAGEGVTLMHPGKAVILAVRAARIVVEVPDGVAVPKVLEVAPADGRPGRRIGEHRPRNALANGVRAFGEWISASLAPVGAPGRTASCPPLHH